MGVDYKYDSELRQIGHYQVYPEMLPYIGENYAKNHPGLMLVAESNYMAEASTAHHKAEEWYAGPNRLTDDEKQWINFRNLTQRMGPIYITLANALTEAKGPPKENGLESMSRVAFMNCFQRPALEGGSINVEPLDVKVSLEVLGKVIEIIRPGMICFTSTQAWSSVGCRLESRFGNIAFEHTPHPVCPWWNRRSSRGKGREVFVKFAKDWFARGRASGTGT